MTPLIMGAACGILLRFYADLELQNKWSPYTDVNVYPIKNPPLRTGLFKQFNFNLIAFFDLTQALASQAQAE